MPELWVCTQKGSSLFFLPVRHLQLYKSTKLQRVDLGQGRSEPIDP